MRWDRKTLLVVAGVASAFAVGAVDAQAKSRGKKHRHRFKSAPARVQPKTPAQSSGGSSNSPVASSAVQGDFRQSVVDGGAVLAMAPGRALVLNSYRGLALVDTTDANSPRVLATTPIEGTGERMFVDGASEVAVVSDTRDANGARTIVTSVAIGDSSLSVLGSASTSGSLRDAVRDGSNLLLVTNDGYFGPIYMTAGAKSPLVSTAAGRPSSGIAYPGYGGDGTSHVARVRVDAGGVPSISGAMDVTGSVVADSVSGTEAVLAVSSGGGWSGGPVPLAGTQGGKPDPTGGNGGGSSTYTPPTVSLVHVTDDASFAPTSAGTLALDGVNGVQALDRSGNVVRAVESLDSGEAVATFDVSGAAPVPLGSLALSDWPSTYVFSGNAFVYSTTLWASDNTLPNDPVFNPAGVSAAFAGQKQSGATSNGMAPGGRVSGPSSTLNVVDLRNPSNLAAGGTLDLGAGWVGSFVAVGNGVVGTTYLYEEKSGQSVTTIFRADVSNPAAPTSVGSISDPGYDSLGSLLGDILLANGGTTASDGSFVATTRLVDLSGGGVARGGSFPSISWTTTAARDGDLVGLASYDRLTLVDVADVNAPQTRGVVRLVVNVAGFAPLDANTGVVLATDYVGGQVEVRTVALPAADALSPLGTVQVGTGDAQMFAAARFVYVVATDWSSGRATLTVVDASDAGNPKARGTLDLASYPGQVFLKGSALLLLRDAGSLFYYVDGRTKPAADPFGKCPRAWLREDLGAVLDVVDLSNPDAPSAARRVHLQWDTDGEAVLAGNSLFVSSYANVTSNSDASDQYAYMVREIDVTNPLNPQAGAAVDVPGSLVAATGAPHRVLTANYSYDSQTGATSTSLCLVDLSRPWQTRVLASRALDGWPETTTVAAGHAYVVVESWGNDPSSNSQTSTATLSTYSASDLSAESTVARDSGAYSGEVHAGLLFLRSWGWNGATDVYSLADPTTPTFALSKNVAGIAGDIAVVVGRAYAAGGMYGVVSFDLN